MKIIQQDMLELRSGILFHQVNCQGIMGGGIAKAFSLKFPGLEKAYREFISIEMEVAYDETETFHLLGKCFLFKVRDGLFVANVFGQDNISTIRRQTSYDATVEAFDAIQDILPAGLPTYFPHKMGCGLGGGDWEIYSAILERYFPDGIICQYT